MIFSPVAVAYIVNATIASHIGAIDITDFFDDVTAFNLMLTIYEDRIEAIKVVKAASGCNLKTALDCVRAVEAYLGK